MCIEAVRTGFQATPKYLPPCLLHRLATAGRTIIFSIHQPRFAIYKLFDTVTLLSEGKLVYHGEASQTLAYFASIGELECMYISRQLHAAAYMYCPF